MPQLAFANTFWQSFDVLEKPIKAHAGAEPVEVVEGRHADVIAAEATLKRQRTAPLRKWRTWRMPASFGKGTEVVRVVVPIRLADVLPAGRDVTDRFVDPARHGGTAARLGNRRRG